MRTQIDKVTALSMVDVSEEWKKEVGYLNFNTGQLGNDLVSPMRNRLIPTSPLSNAGGDSSD